jgi:arabinose-5-phosphate isomerase
MIKLIAFDFDGVFTDGKCYFNGDRIQKYYDIKDGKAMGLLRDNNMVTVLISSYKTRTSDDKEVFWNDDKIEDQIASHLKFDKVSIGAKEDKIDILMGWLSEYDISLDEVAYIGDDLADLKILKAVGFSACPADAVDECKEVVDYVCQKKGGDVCVREFVEQILSRQTTTTTRRGELIICEMRKELNYQLDEMDIVKIEKVCDTIRNSKGNIYFTGIGKSKNAAIECCILLKSINIKSFYLDAIECHHGNIGTVNCDDLVIMYSKSGNTSELIDLINILEIKKCKTIGVCCDPNSKFEKACDYTIQLPFNKEISGNITKIPTNSYMSQIIFSNILVSILKEDIDLSTYRLNHLGGNIGKHLETLEKYMIEDYPKFVLRDNIPLIDILIKMTDKKIGCSFFTDDDDTLLGILTDGDIRRLILSDKKFDVIRLNNINEKYYYETDINKYVCNCKKMSYIPLLNDNRLIGVCDLTII